jgi:DNA repair exonuclease SbcCD ATPase subunit
MLVEIDRNGEAHINNRRMNATQLRAWAEKYIQRHEKGSVVIRSHARAYVCDIERARDELKIGGVFEFDEQRLLPEGILPPRTAEQSAEQLAEWQKMFRNPAEEIVDPGRQAAEALAQVQSELERMADRKTLLEHYQKQLREQQAAYEAGRKARPAGDGRDEPAGGQPTDSGKDAPAGAAEDTGPGAKTDEPK